MSKNKKPKPMNRNQKAQIEAKARQLENLPMNKDFLHVKDEEGEIKYPIVERLLRYKMMSIEDMEDTMRQIAAYVAQIKHHQNRIARLTAQYGGTVVERDENGRLYTREEIQLLIMSEKIAIPRDLSSIRGYAVDKLLPLIDGERFTGEQYNDYITEIDVMVQGLGYELLPAKVEMILPEFL